MMAALGRDTVRMRSGGRTGAAGLAAFLLSIALAGVLVADPVAAEKKKVPRVKAAAAAKPSAAVADQDAVAPAAVATTAITVPLPAPPPLPKIYTLPAKQVFGKVVQGATADMPARAIGGYAKGCMSGGTALPIDGPYWQAMRLSRNRNWGHPQLVALLQRYAKEMREQENWPGLLIGDISQPRGGPMLTGHKSHQVGLDADLWFLPMPDRTLTRKEREVFEPMKLAEERGTQVIPENWNPGFVGLVKRAAMYPEVERILLHPAIKRALCEATPEADRGWLRKVRPTWSHNYHFHVRLFCPGDQPGCVPQKPTLPDHGCGKDLEDWLKRLNPPKPKPKPKPPAPPVPPKPPGPPKPKPKPKVQTILELPDGCAAVAINGTDEPLLVKTKAGIAPVDAADAAGETAEAPPAGEAPADP